MGGQSIILGYIKEPSVHNKDNVLIRNHNRSKIFSLGRMDDFPPLNSTFFSQTSGLETFSNSLLYFAGSFKEIEADWEEWLKKFESFLKTLIWESVYLRLETYLGEYEYRWEASEEIISTFEQEFPKRVTDWTFVGSPRNFKE